jgi:dTDP-4-dehydrorhamnose reductase
MLGSMVRHVLSGHPELDVVATTRHNDVDTVAFEVGRSSIADLINSTQCEWIVNAIGVLDRAIDETDPVSVANAIDVNARFPHALAGSVLEGQRVINPATDGVFSGRDAPYDEEASHDADGVYARSKSLGEVRSPRVINLRCSIVGPEEPPAGSLLGWALSQPFAATIVGYTNHRWNGLTSLHFAKICSVLILGADRDLPTTLHVVPEDSVNKAELLSLGLEAFGRSDVTVAPQPAAARIDRTLRTIHADLNRQLWSAAGYPGPPKISQMMDELARFGR